MRAASPRTLADGRSSTCLIAIVLLGCLDDGGTIPVADEHVDHGLPGDMGDAERPDVLPDAAADADPSARCAPLTEPEHLDLATVVDRGPCPDGHAVRWTAAPGTRFTVRLIPLDADAEGGTAELWWPHPVDPIRADRRPLDDDAPWIWSEPVDGAIVRVSSPGRWRMAVGAVLPEVEPTAVTGQITGWQRPVTDDGLGDALPFGTAGARVDLLDGEGGWLALTRIAGDGRFELRARAPDGPATVRLVSEASVAGLPVRVGPDGRLPWGEAVAEVRGSAEVELALDPAGATAGAWHVARTIADALTALGPLLPPTASAPPPVRVRWRPGFSEGCGSCFRPGDAPLIELGGRISDPDEWDRAVVVHELGHYIAAVFSRDDSGGGPHDGSPIAPAVAWSEGLATFIASWPDRPVQLDYTLAGVARLDLEAMPQPEAFGTADGTAEGPISERLVAATLWDLFDAPAADDDPAALGDEAIFEPLFEILTGPWSDRGAPGIDLVDYLDALWCVAPDPAVGDVLSSRDMPHTPSCRAKSRGPLTARTLADGRVELMPAASGRLRSSDGTVQWVAAGQRVIWRAPRGAVGGAMLDYAGGRAVVTLNPPEQRAAPIMRRAGAWELRSDRPAAIRARAGP